jgi:hypothetical protein
VASSGRRAGQCPFISRFVECQNTFFIYRRLAFFQGAASSADEKRVYYAIRLEVTRSEGGSPLSMNPMRGGGPAAVCTREHKADFSDLRRVTKHTARTAVKTPSAAVFHSSARFSCLNRFHSCLAKAGETYLSKPRTFGSQT